ncbi:MAG: fused MFS/spermidine synthase [bacterium]
MSASKRILVHLLLILSGTASLIYEVLWVRVLQYSFGNTDLAVSTVLAVFMGGLALGAYVGGRIAERFERPVLVYGVLELIIALYALAVTPALYHMDFIYGLVGVDAGTGTLTLMRLATATVLLIIPTVCMGATLPVLTVPLVRLERTGEGVGLLYFVNTLGAVVGSALAGFVLIRFLGLNGSLYVGVVFGILVFFVALLLQRTVPGAVAARATSADGDGDAAAAEAKAEAQAAEAKQAAALSAHAGLDVLSPDVGGYLVLFAAGMCGYISLVNEVVWTRMLGFLLDGTVYGFSALLASFLMGIALGSLLISPFIDQSRDLWGLFGKVQILAAVGCVLTILMIPMVPSLADAFIGSGTAVEGGFALKVFIVFLIVLVPCLFFGAAFPICVTIASHYGGAVSSSMGSVYAANTVGSILGSISGGMILLSLTHDLNTILVLMVFLSLLLALSAGCASTVAQVKRAVTGPPGERLAIWRKGLGLVAMPMALLVVVGVVWPDVNIYRLVCTRYAVEDYDRSLGFKVARAEKQVEKMVFQAQGRVTVVTVHRLNDGGLRLRNNGLNEAYHGTSDPRYAEVIFYLGVLPYLLHPKPERALQIGLGGGGTAECLTKTDLKKLTVVELEKEVVTASRYIYKTLLGKGRHPFDDPRVESRVDDGRNALLRAARARPNHYDIIVSQPSHAWLSGVASLYTREHFGVVRRNLRKGGIFCQWINLFRMDEEGLRALMAAFTGAFPSVHVFQVDTNSLLLIGGDERLKLDPDTVKRHLKEKRLKSQAEMFSIDVYSVFRTYLFGKKTADALAKGHRPNSDRYPIIEMRLPWVLHNNTVDIRKLLKREKLAWGVSPEIFHKGKGWKRFLRGMAEDLIGEYDTDKWPLPRVRRFVDRAARELGTEGLMLQARLAQIEGATDRAEKLYLGAAAAGKHDALFMLGSIYLTLERYREAVKLCGQAYEKTKRADAHLCAAEGYYHRGELLEARTVLEAMLLRKEHDFAPAAQKWLGIIDYRQGRFELARKRLLAYLRLDSSDDEAPYYLGLLEAARGNHTKARERFAAAVANSRSLAEAASGQGKRYAKLNHQASAVTRFRAALRRQLDLTAAYKWMASALRRWGRYAEMDRTLELLGKHDSASASTFRMEFQTSASLSERLGTVLHSHRKKL